MAKRKPLIPPKAQQVISTHLIAASIGLTAGVWGTLAAVSEQSPSLSIPTTLTTTGQTHETPQ